MLKSLVRMLLGRSFSDRLWAHEISFARLGRVGKAGCAAVFGKAVHCPLCGGRIAKVLPVMRRGRVEVWGIDQSVVRVEFADRNALRFTHVFAENCASLRHHDRS